MEEAENINYSIIEDLGWTEYPSLQYQRHYTSFYIYNNKYLYCFFGYNGNRGSLNTIERMDLDLNLQWDNVNITNKHYLDLNISSHGCIYANPDEVYIVGGCTSDKFSDKILKYNFVQNAIYLTEMTIPGLKDHEYFRFWEESTFKSLSSFGNQFSSDDDYTFGMFDAKEKLHLFNSRTFKYTII